MLAELSAYAASGQIEAIVVTSFTMMNVESVRAPQGPRAAIKAIEELLVPAASPGFPPCVTR
jgi:hypothetical protein